MVEQFTLAAISWLLVLGLVVTVHEFGHFLAARALGTKIDVFSIGFGKPLAQWKDKSGVEWRIAWLPIGGYVRFAGDDNASSIPTAEELMEMRSNLVAQGRVAEISRYFHFKPIWQRAVIIAAGPAANFLLAILIFAVLLMGFGETLRPFTVAQVVPGSAAAEAGFRTGDKIIEANGIRVRQIEDVVEVATIRAQVPTTFLVRRGGDEVRLTATPRWELVSDPIAGEQRVGRLGLKPNPNAETIHITYGPIKAIGGGAARTWRTLTTTMYYLGRMVTGQVDSNQIRGPLGIATVAKNVAQMGAAGAPDLLAKVAGVGLNLIQLAAVISISIGFMNLLPVPVLDGGHLLFLACEAITRRPLAAKVQAAGYRTGLALVLGLMLFATWNDLQRLRVFNLFDGLFS